MSSSQAWAEALNISPENLEEWSRQAPQGTPLLVHCLEQGLVSAPEYLEWASDHYGLAVLSPLFFQDAIDTTWLANEMNQGQWKPWMYPVQSWDGTMFIACSEPPEHETFADCRYVLADPRAMKDAWLQAGGAVSEAAPAASVEFDAPIGITAQPQPFKLNLDLTNVMSPGENLAPEEPEPVHEVVETVREPTVLSSIHLSFPSEDQETAVAASPAPTPAIDDATPLPVKLKTQPVAPTSLPKDEDGAVKTVFAQLNQAYAHAFVMKVSDANAKLYKWDPGLSPSSPSQVLVNLVFPTFFRILAKTGMPYHGYLVDTPAHREFFSSLGLVDLPGCVTAVPLRLGETLWGILVAVGDEKLQTLEHLQKVEAGAQSLIAAMGPTWGKAA